MTKRIFIVGGGLMGSAAAWKLASLGKRVTLLEWQSQNYQTGSSKGEARISRSLGPPRDIWSYLHNRSVEEARYLISYLNEFGEQSHHLEEIYTTSPVTYLLPDGRTAVIRRALERQTDTYQASFSPTEARRVFDMKVENQVVVKEYKSHSGTINPKSLIEKLHQGIIRKGGLINYRRQVVSLVKTDDGFTIDSLDSHTGDTQTQQADQLILAAGPYNQFLLNELWIDPEITIEPKRVLLGFFQVNPQTFQSLSENAKQQLIDCFPVIDVANDHLFAMIERFEGELPIIKAGGHFLRDTIDDLDRVWEQKGSDEAIDKIKQLLIQYMEMYDFPLDITDLQLVDSYSCVYSLTPSETPIVDFVADDVMLIGGMSGVGAKGSLAYGAIAANKIMGIQEAEFMYNKTETLLSLQNHLEHT